MRLGRARGYTEFSPLHRVTWAPDLVALTNIKSSFETLTAHRLTDTIPLSWEICTEVVDRDFERHAVYLPHEVINKPDVGGVGGKETPQCRDYTVMEMIANSTCCPEARAGSGDRKPLLAQEFSG